MSDVMEVSVTNPQGTELPLWHIRQDERGLWYVRNHHQKDWDGPYTDTKHAISNVAHALNAFCDDVNPDLP